jgi:hypothetical protein
MIHPTCLEVLSTVQSALTREIIPRLTDVDARSTAATIEHLLRHIALRIEHEGQILTTDIARLCDLLKEAAQWQQARGTDPSPLRDLLAAEAREGAGYRNLDQLGAAALRLRAALVDVQRQLMAVEGDDISDALHARMRDYIALQLTDEAKLIDPAFTGRGPRR